MTFSPQGSQEEYVPESSQRYYQETQTWSQGSSQTESDDSQNTVLEAQQAQPQPPPLGCVPVVREGSQGSSQESSQTESEDSQNTVSTSQQCQPQPPPFLHPLYELGPVVHEGSQTSSQESSQTESDDSQPKLSQEQQPCPPPLGPPSDILNPDWPNSFVIHDSEDAKPDTPSQVVDALAHYTERANPEDSQKFSAICSGSQLFCDFGMLDSSCSRATTTPKILDHIFPPESKDKFSEFCLRRSRLPRGTESEIRKQLERCMAEIGLSECVVRQDGTIMAFSVDSILRVLISVFGNFVVDKGDPLAMSNGQVKVANCFEMYGVRSMVVLQVKGPLSETSHVWIRDVLNQFSVIGESNKTNYFKVPIVAVVTDVCSFTVFVYHPQTGKVYKSSDHEALKDCHQEQFFTHVNIFAECMYDLLMALVVNTFETFVEVARFLKHPTEDYEEVLGYASEALVHARDAVGRTSSTDESVVTYDTIADDAYITLRGYLERSPPRITDFEEYHQLMEAKRRSFE